MSDKVNRRFIKYSYESSGGIWGAGSSAYEAIEQWRKEGGSVDKAESMIVFESDLPFIDVMDDMFVPSDKAAAWVNCLGQLCWIRCEKLD